MSKHSDNSYLCLSQTRQVHLLIEEVDHLLLGETEWNISNVDSPGLAGDGGPDHGDGGLRRVGHERGGDLARLLHALVLHGRDVLEPRGRHIPVQTWLPSLASLLPITVSASVSRSGSERFKYNVKTILVFLVVVQDLKS